jgi:hypothetical protein
VVAAVVGVVLTALVGAPAGGRTPEIAPLAGLAGAVFRDVQAQSAPGDLSPVELLNGLLGVLFSGESNERKASGAACFAVLWNVDVHDLTDLAEDLTELLVRRGKVEVPYEYLV